MNNLKLIIAIICFLVAIGGPIYQMVESKINNVEGDGIETLGNNPIFRNILGIKTIHYVFFAGQGWESWGIDIENPKWMQYIGFDKTVKYCYPAEFNQSSENSSFIQQTMLFLLRTFIKLLYFVLFMFLAIKILPKEQTNN